MAKYRKRPVVTEAIQWTGENFKEIIDFTRLKIIVFTGLNNSAKCFSWEECEALVRKEGLNIFTLEGTHTVSIGDYIIKGFADEIYPCKPDIFEKSYEAV